jgi:hypothetical protein
LRIAEERDLLGEDSGCGVVTRFAQEVGRVGAAAGCDGQRKPAQVSAQAFGSIDVIRVVMLSPSATAQGMLREESRHSKILPANSALWRDAPPPWND